MRAPSSLESWDACSGGAFVSLAVEGARSVDPRARGHLLTPSFAGGIFSSSSPHKLRQVTKEQLSLSLPHPRLSQFTASTRATRRAGSACHLKDASGGRVKGVWGGPGRAIVFVSPLASLSVCVRVF